MRYMVIGSGGIGLALAEQLLLKGEEVIVASRHQPLNKKQASYFPLDLNNKKSIDAMFASLKENLPDVVINTIGILHDSQHQPEKSLKQMDEDWFLESMKVNAFSTLSLVDSLSKVLSRASVLKWISISARVGSISENRSGGWFSYRMSKAALNMGIKNISIEWKRNYPACSIIAYQPGTVDTSLSKPFQGNVQNLMTAHQAAQYLIDFIPHITPSSSGNFYDWKQELISY